MKVNDRGALAGFGWHRTAWRILLRSPLTWLFMVGGWLGMSVVVMIFPLVGQVIGSILQPVFQAGLMIAAERSQAGSKVVPPLLFAGFRLKSFKQLVALGAIDFAVMFVAVIVFITPMLAKVPDGADNETVARALVAALDGNEWRFYATVAVAAVAKTVLWFCTPLLAFNEDMRIGHALRWSVYAALSNLGAMILFGIGLVALTFVFTLPLALLRLAVLAPFIVMVFMIVLVLANYASYRSVFDEATPPGPAAAAA